MTERKELMVLPETGADNGSLRIKRRISNFFLALAKLLFRLLKFISSIIFSNFRRNNFSEDDNSEPVRKYEFRPVNGFKESANHSESVGAKNEESKTERQPSGAEVSCLQCIGHPNRTLALRYGLVNDSATIRLVKVDALAETEGHYLAELPDFNGRRVRAVLTPDLRIVKTFYPMDEGWFEKYAFLEEILKDNSAFSLKELAVFHVDAKIKANL